MLCDNLDFLVFFLVVSPSEWSFPLPPWLKQLQTTTGLAETDLSAYEMLHFVNVLEQLVTGYMCGSNDSKWTCHLFAHTQKTQDRNVLNYFYRFKFQKRGTVHIHILACISAIFQSHLEHIRADIPWARC